MRIFLRFRNAQLRFIHRRNICAEGVGKVLRLERHMHTRAKGLIVLRHANIVQREEPFFAVKAIKLRQDKRTGNLPCPVRPEIEEDHAVIRPNRANRRAVFCNDHRNDKFIRHTCIVGSLHCRLGILRLNAFAINERRICFFHAFKAVVPVHCVITPHHGRNFTAAKRFQLVFQRMDISLAAFRRHIAPIHEAVDEYVFQAVFAREFYQRIKMR